MSLDESLARDKLSKPWQAFLRQNPGIGPLVESYLNGGARPDLAQLEPNHYAVARVLAEDARRGVGEPPPPPGLPFAEPELSNPVRPAISPSTTSFACDSGKDYLIDLGMEPRPTLVLTGSPRRVQIRNYHCRVTGGSSAFWRGGIGLQLKAEHVSLTNYYTEGTPAFTDAIRIACGRQTKVTIQRALVEMPSDSQEPSEHLDSLQVQGAVGRIEVGLSTFQVAGVRPPNHGGKGFQLDILSAIGETGGPFTVDLRSVDFELLSSSSGARSIMAIGKDDNSSIPILLTDVYGSGSLPFENMLVNYPSALGKSITGSAPNRVLTFTNPAQGWTGEFRERGQRPHFVTREMLGV